MKSLLFVLAVFAGMILPFQAIMNSRMGKALGDPVYAALISFSVGTVSLFFYALMISRTEFSVIRHAFQLHWSLWTAGALGAFYVTSVIILTPRLGASLTFSLVVAGQLAMAVILDHFGCFGMPVQPVNLPRLAGIVLITAGVFLIRRF